MGLGLGLACRRGWDWGLNGLNGSDFGHLVEYNSLNACPQGHGAGRAGTAGSLHSHINYAIYNFDQLHASTVHFNGRANLVQGRLYSFLQRYRICAGGLFAVYIDHNVIISQNALQYNSSKNHCAGNADPYSSYKTWSTASFICLGLVFKS